MLRAGLLLVLPLSLLAQSWSKAEVATDEVFFVDDRESKPSLRTIGDATSQDEGLESYAKLRARVQLLESRLADAEARRLEDITKEMLNVAFEKESASQEIHDWMFIALFILLISLSIFFELGQGALLEKLERNSAHEGLLNVVTALQKELTLLGFVVLVATALQKTGGMEALSNLLTDCFQRTSGTKMEKPEKEPENEEEAELELAELFEDVHMLLFLIMVCFIMIVLILLTLAVRRQHLYDQAESKKTKDLKAEFEKLRCYQWYEKMNLLHKMQYRILRTEFFRNAKKKGELVRPASFKFSNYMGACMAEFIVQLIEIPIPTWFFLMVLVLCVKPFLALKHSSLALGMMVTSLCLFLMLLGMTFMIWQTYKMCLPQTCPSYYDIHPQSGGKSAHKTTPRYIDKMGFTKPRTTVEYYVRLWFWGTVSPTKQEQCFPFWKNGPRVNNFFIRLQVFGHAVFLGSYFRVLCVDPSFVANHWIAALIQWIPFLCGLGYIWPHLLYWNTIATCTGNSMNEKIMSRVIRQQTEATFRQYHYLIQGISMLTRIWQIRCLKSLEEYANYVTAFVNASRGVLENEEKNECVEAFRRWDSDNNGIDREELSHVLQAYGMKPEISEYIAETWFAGEIFRTGIEFEEIDQDAISAKPMEPSRKATKPYLDDNGSCCVCFNSRDDGEGEALLSPDRDEYFQAKMISARFYDPRDADEHEKNKKEKRNTIRHEDILFANEDETAVAKFECKDKLTEVEFEFLMMQQRELDHQGCSAEKICSWLKKHVCHAGAPDTILPEHFLKDSSKLYKLAQWCGINDEAAVHQLFLVVKNPDDEEQIIKEVHCEDFAEWLLHTMHTRSDHGGSRHHLHHQHTKRASPRGSARH